MRFMRDSMLKSDFDESLNYLNIRKVFKKSPLDMSIFESIKIVYLKLKLIYNCIPVFAFKQVQHAAIDRNKGHEANCNLKADINKGYFRPMLAQKGMGTVIKRNSKKQKGIYYISYCS